MKHYKKTLPSGLRIITIPMKDTPTITTVIMVEAGSKYETRDINGLSHFLEHMCFKGTQKRPSPGIIAHEFDSMGSSHNAFTSHEYTGYYGKAHKKHFPKILDLLSDMYMNPILDEDEINKEKGVIIEEINMYEDVPMRNVYDKFLTLMYGDQPAGWTILGPIRNIKKMTREHFIEYRDKHYVAGKTIVLVAGNIDRKTSEERVSKAFRDIPSKKKAGKEKVKETQKSPALSVTSSKTGQTHMMLGVRTFAAKDKRADTLEVLNTILGRGMSSRLFKKFREEMGVCYYVRSESEHLTDHGFLVVSAGVDKKRLEEVVEATLFEFKRLKKELVDDAELQKAKDYMIGNMYLRLEASDDVALSYAREEIVAGRTEDPEVYAKKIRKVTAKNIQKVAKEIFKSKNLNLALIGNAKNKGGLKKLLKI